MKRFVLLILSILLIISSSFFSKTDGLVCHGSTKYSIQYCTEYQDSMANDNVVIEFGKIVFLIVLIIQIVFIKKKITILEISFYLLICLFLIGLLFDIQSDGCSIHETIVYTKNLSLLVYIISFFLFFLFNIVLLIKKTLGKKKCCS
jgi:hypothetical protein